MTIHVRLLVPAALAAIAFVASTVTPTDAAANKRRVVRGTDTGLAQTLHPSARERGLTCLTDHFHVGSSSGQRNKKAAETAAIADWSSFTAWEYGTLWANFKVAGTKTVSCLPSGNSWGCSVSARACRR